MVPARMLRLSSFSLSPLLSLQLMAFILLGKKPTHTVWPLCDANDALFNLIGITRVTKALKNLTYISTTPIKHSSLAYRLAFVKHPLAALVLSGLFWVS